jgi:replicative DNA helicase
MQSTHVEQGDVRAEEMLLSLLLNEESARNAVFGVVEKHHFGQAHHGLIYEAMQKASAAGALDVMSLQRILTEEQLLAQVGGLTAIGKIQDGLPEGIKPESLVNSILAAHSRRRLSSLLLHGVDQLSAGAGWRKVFEEVERKAAEISDTDSTMRLAKSSEGAASVLEATTTAAISGKPPGIPTGIAALDSILSGLHKGDLFYIAARPSEGKTSLMDQIILNVASAGISVATFSLEMTLDKQATRFLANMAGIDSKLIKCGELRPNQWVMLIEACHRLQSLPIYVDDSRPMSVMQLAAKCRRHIKDVGPIGLIAVDYVQLLRSGLNRNRNDDANAEITNVSHALKDLAGELEVPILALCQMNRKIEESRERRPVLSDLMGASALEQDADAVAFLHRVRDQEGAETGDVEIIIQKQRDGGTGALRSAFVRPLSMFCNNRPELLPA